MLPLILASGSPRRRELLDLMGLVYTVETPDVDESFSGKPAETVMEISRRKAVAVAGRHDEAIIIAADTLVFADGPVSYTHLDVYKRQLHGWRACGFGVCRCFNG